MSNEDIPDPRPTLDAMRAVAADVGFDPRYRLVVVLHPSGDEFSVRYATEADQ